MKQEQILIGVASFIIIYFLLVRIQNQSANNASKVSKTTTVVKTTAYKPVISPNYVQAHYNPTKIKYY